MLPVVLVALSLSSALAEDLPPLDVYILPHTHLDVGWLETFDSYYYLNVSRMLPGIIDGLMSDKTKRFAWAEMTYFEKWWREDSTPLQQQQLKQLVNQSQWEFVDGGLVQHDQACVTAQDVVNHMTAGHAFIFEHFGVRPTIGWALDPFGASAANAALYAKMGYNAIVLNRIPFWDLNNMMANKTLEFMWRPSASLPVNDSQLFAHVLDSYFCSPHGYQWSWAQEDAPWVYPSNVAQITQNLANILLPRRAWFRTNVLLVPWGCDFMWQNATVVWMNTDQIIKEANSNPTKYGFTIRYATPSEYFNAIYATQTPFPVRTPAQSDFFPLVYQWSQDNNVTWSGFYTSRATLKYASRHATAAIHSAEIGYALAYAMDPGASYKSEFEVIEKARFDQAISLHHDAITGTMCVASEGCSGGGQDGGAHDVLQDYLDLQAGAIKTTDKITARMYARLAGQNGQEPGLHPITEKAFARLLQQRKQIAVVLTNPLASTRTEVVSIDVPIGGISVMDSTGTAIPAVVNDLCLTDGGYRGAATPTPYVKVLSFEVTLPPLGFTTVFLSACAVGSSWPFNCADGGPTQPEIPVASAASRSREERDGSGVLWYVMDNQFLTVYANEYDGVVAMLDKATGKNHTMKYSMRTYQSNSGDDAYALDVVGGSAPAAPNGIYQSYFFPGTIVDVLYLQVTKELTHVVRVYHSADPLVGGYVEVRHDVGVLDINTELVVQFQTDIQNVVNGQPQIFTDGNNFEMMARSYNPQILPQQNTWPATSSVIMKDGASQLSIVTEQTHGAILEGPVGTVQLNIARRMRMPGSVSGNVVHDEHTYHSQKILFALGAVQAANRERHALLARLAFPIRALVAENVGTPQSWAANYVTTFSPVASLPPNLHLFSLGPYDDQGTMTLRLQHVYEAGEDAVYSQPASVDLGSFFQSPITVSSSVEKTLNMNQNLANVNRMQWNTLSTEGANKRAPADEGAAITLGPQDIRSFAVTLKSSS